MCSFYRESAEILYEKKDNHIFYIRQNYHWQQKHKFLPVKQTTAGRKILNLYRTEMIFK